MCIIIGVFGAIARFPSKSQKISKKSLMNLITENNVVKKAKGVSKVVVKKNISFDDYKNCVLNDTPKRVKINAIRTLKLTNYSLTEDKLVLSNKDDKRVWFDKSSSRAYGHFRN